MRIYGIDFTSAPTQRKTITVAVGEAKKDRLVVSAMERIADFPAFEAFLATPGPWVGGFDFPFGLARQAVTDLLWPDEWSDLLDHCQRMGKAEFKRKLDAYRESRPAGSRYAKRRGDDASNAHPSVKLINPPVGFMFFEGAPRLARAAVHVPGIRRGDPSRVALEAYPGLLVRQLGIAGSYKNDAPIKQTSARQAVRRQIVAAIKAGKPHGTRVSLPSALERALIQDGSGDLLDAVLCAVQAHWGYERRERNFGLPDTVDPLEGWIVSAQ